MILVGLAVMLVLAGLSLALWVLWDSSTTMDPAAEEYASALAARQSDFLSLVEANPNMRPSQLVAYWEDMG